MPRTDFKNWSRENLEDIARQAVDENKQLREDNKMLLDQWRKAVTEKCQDEALAESPDPRWPSQ
jgi:hypothetical protein